MSHTHKRNRRNFLSLSAKLAALGLGSLAGLRTPGVFAMEQNGGGSASPDVTDYKALVCVYLFGGNDANNMIVPVDPARYTAYQSIRGGLALGGASLLPPVVDANGNQYAFHYGMPELKALYDQGKMAVVLNTGQLQQPLTRQEYLTGAQAPTNLFSHSDQTVQQQTGMPTANGTGWGGRLLDCFGNADSLAAVSLASPALFLQGYNVGGNAIPVGVTLNIAGMSFWPQTEANVRRQALDDMLLLNGGNTIRTAANKSMSDGLLLSQALQQAASGPSVGTFPGTALGNQLRDIAKLIAVRSQQGPGRQVFFCALDGFDTHGAQDWQHWHLLSTLSQAANAFYGAMGGAGLASNVTLFTQSEFGRTLQPSGSGSDHAWGSHQLVIGGGVKGGIYGALPTFALGGPDDANNRGVWIPKIATTQFGATLGKWFGASPANVAWAFPTLGQFGSSDVGFMS